MIKPVFGTTPKSRQPYPAQKTGPKPRIRQDQLLARIPIILERARSVRREAQRMIARLSVSSAGRVRLSGSGRAIAEAE
jgi:hypothetical protein